MKPIEPASTQQSFPEPGLQKKRLKECCQEFESFMTSFIVKSMREGVMRAEEPDRALGMYEGMMDQAVCKEFSRGRGLGLANAIYKQLEPLVREQPQVCPPAADAPQTAPQPEKEA